MRVGVHAHVCVCVYFYVCVCGCADQAIEDVYILFLRFHASIFVDPVKHSVLTFVSEIQCYRNDHYYSYYYWICHATTHLSVRYSAIEMTTIIIIIGSVMLPHICQ